MRLGRRTTRAVVLLVGLGLLTLLPQASANAESSTKYGSPHNFKANGGMWNLGPMNLSPDCNGTAYYVAQKLNNDDVKYSMKYTTKCSAHGTGFNDIFGDLANRVVTIKGVRQDTNEVCEMSGTGRAENSTWGFTESGTVELGSKSGSSGSTDPLSGLFDFNSVCLPTSMKSDPKGGGGAGKWAANLSLGALPTFAAAAPDRGTCTLGTVESVTLDSHQDPTSGSFNGTQWDVVTVKWATTAPATGTWILRPIMIDRNTGVPAPSSTTMYAANDVQLTSSSTGTVSVTKGTASSGTQGVGYSTDSTWAQYKMVGYLVYNPTVRNASGSGLTSTPNTLGTWARTKPSACAFYVGPKAFDDTTADTDEPWSTSVPGLGTETPPADPATPDPKADPGAPDAGCTFSISDPSSWATGSLCAMTGLLGKIVNLLVQLVGVIANLATTLVELIGGLLKDLLIPNPKSWNTGGVRDQFNARPPGSIIAASASGISAAASAYSDGGCGNIFTIDVPRGGNAVVTCGRVASTPGYSALYSLVSVGLMALTGLALFKMFSGAFTRGES